MVLFVACLVVSLCGLVFVKQLFVVALLQFVVIGTLVALAIALTSVLHDLLPSHIRASSVSATSTFGRALIIPLALLFGYVSEQSSVFSATYILLVLSMVMSLFVFTIRRKHVGSE